jgi:hypothetical protein
MRLRANFNTFTTFNAFGDGIYDPKSQQHASLEASQYCPLSFSYFRRVLNQSTRQKICFDDIYCSPEADARAAARVVSPALVFEVEACD